MSHQLQFFYQDIRQKDHSLEMYVDATPLSKAARGPGAPQWLHIASLGVCQGGSVRSQARRASPGNGFGSTGTFVQAGGDVEQPALESFKA